MTKNQINQHTCNPDFGLKSKCLLEYGNSNIKCQPVPCLTGKCPGFSEFVSILFYVIYCVLLLCNGGYEKRSLKKDQIMSWPLQCTFIDLQSVSCKS